jgi:hypothetical protein
MYRNVAPTMPKPNYDSAHETHTQTIFDIGEEGGCGAYTRQSRVRGEAYPWPFLMFMGVIPSLMTIFRGTDWIVCSHWGIGSRSWAIKNRWWCRRRRRGPCGAEEPLSRDDLGDSRSLEAYQQQLEPIPWQPSMTGLFWCAPDAGTVMQYSL